MSVDSFSGCAGHLCHSYDSLEEAIDACDAHSNCSAVAKELHGFVPHAGIPSGNVLTGFISWKKGCGMF